MNETELGVRMGTVKSCGDGSEGRLTRRCQLRPEADGRSVPMGTGVRKGLGMA